jgi:cupin 2 domain-containing protein
MKNLFKELPTELAEELVTVLAENAFVRVERIVSTGQSSPDGYWYDQTEHEWVVLLRGAATLEFEDDASRVDLKPGDHVNIAARRKHRVESTSAEAPTVWLAVFYADDQHSRSV